MTDQRIHKWFWRATSNMSLQEFMLLMSCGKHIPNIYYFDSQSRSALQFRPGLLAWPVEYLLAFHSPKHVFGGRTRPSLRTVGQALNAWEHRLRWKLALQGSTPNPWNFLSGPNRFTRHCPLTYSNQVENFFQDMSSSVFKEVLRIRSRTNRCRALLDNSNGVVKLALNILEQGRLMALKTDKDGGFTLVEKSALKTESLRILSNEHMYSKQNLSTSLADDLIAEFRSAVVFSLPDFLIREGPEQKQFLDAMFKPLQRRHCRAFSKLRYTVKTHKADGAVEWRAIHSSVDSPFSSAMSLVANLLKPALARLPHLLHNSHQVVQRLSEARIPEDAFFLRIDIREFFMSGLHTQFLEFCTPLVDKKWQNHFRALLTFILGSQYVTMEGCTDSVWQVKRGAGMGLSCSGEVCDATFYASVELALIPALPEFSVFHYFRFKDDLMLIVGGNAISRFQLLSKMKGLSKVWALKVESIESDSCSFLDLQISKGPRWKRTKCLDICVFRKPSSQSQVLGSNSLHPAHVHRSWPAAMVKRAKRLCNTHKAVEQEILHLKQLVGARNGTAYAQMMVRDVPQLPSHPKQTFEGYMSRIIFPFHRDWWFGSLHSTVKRVLLDHSRSLVNATGKAIHVQIAYKLAHPPLSSVLFQTGIHNLMNTAWPILVDI